MDYKATLNLPKTAFPMKANLPESEPKMLAWWEQFGMDKRLGVFGDWDNPYVTMAPAYQAIIAREFGRFVGRGLVHKGLKPVHWCMHCKTALAQAEVEYEDQRTPSVWVKFPLTSVPAELQTKLAGRRAFAVIWTTPPWPLPANLALPVHPTQSYIAVEAFGEVYIVALARVNDFLTVLGNPQHGVLGRFEGAQLVGHTFRHPWIDREGTIAAADFVAMHQGTCLVHIAPGRGEEDYDRGRSLALPSVTPVGDDGRVVPRLQPVPGRTVWDANP